MFAIKNVKIHALLLAATWLFLSIRPVGAMKNKETLIKAQEKTINPLLEKNPTIQQKIENKPPVIKEDEDWEKIETKDINIFEPTLEEIKKELQKRRAKE